MPRDVLSMEEVRIKSINLVSRCLRAGPIKKTLTKLVSTGRRSAFNVLNFFVQLDARFLPVTENDAEEALDAYNAFVWDASKSNLSDCVQCRR